MPPPLPGPGTQTPLVIPGSGLTALVNWQRDVAAAQSSQITAGMTLGSDAIAAAGTMNQAGAASFMLASDAIAAAGITTTPGLGTVGLLDDVVFASSRPLPFAYPALTLADDVVRALIAAHPVTMVASGLVLADDLAYAAGSAAPSSIATTALLLRDDLVVVVATAHPVTTVTTGTTGLGVPLGSDSVLALDGRSWARLNHILGSDLVTAAALIVMPPAAGTASLTLQSDVVRADSEAFPQTSATAALALADDQVVVSVAAAMDTSRPYADPFGARFNPAGVTTADPLAGTLAQH